MGNVGKLFGVSPASHYLGVKDAYSRMRIDIACAVACWEDENYKYEQAKENAGKEAEIRGDNLDTYKRQLEER